MENKERHEKIKVTEANVIVKKKAETSPLEDRLCGCYEFLIKYKRAGNNVYEYTNSSSSIDKVFEMLEKDFDIVKEECKCKCKESKTKKDLKALMQEVREGIGVLMSCLITMETDIYTREVEKENKNKVKLLMLDADREMIGVYSAKYLEPIYDKLKKEVKGEESQK